MLKAAFIGMGDIYPSHLSAVQALEHVTVTAVCDTNPSAATRAPAGAAFYQDYEEMVRQCTPDCVHICLPHFLHYPVGKRLAEEGISIFCEKPVALNTAQAEAFTALEAAYPQIKMGVCLQNRCNETVQQLKHILESGRYGRVTGCKGLVPWARGREYYTQKPWRGNWATAGGGCMINQALHTLDLLYYLCGPVARLRGTTAQLLDYGIEVEDTACAQLQFTSGATGVFWATNAHCKNESVQISVVLEHAEFTITDGTLFQRASDGTWAAICKDSGLPGAKFYYGSGHLAAIRQFYEALEHNTDHYIHVRDAEMSIRLIDAIHRSAQCGKTVELY